MPDDVILCLSPNDSLGSDVGSDVYGPSWSPNTLDILKTKRALPGHHPDLRLGMIPRRVRLNKFITTLACPTSLDHVNNRKTIGYYKK